MARYAVVVASSGLVENIAEWDGVSAWALPPGRNAIQSSTAAIGSVYNGSSFTTPTQVTDQFNALVQIVRDYVTDPQMTGYLAATPGSLTNAQRDSAGQKTAAALVALAKALRIVVS